MQDPPCESAVQTAVGSCAPRRALGKVASQAVVSVRRHPRAASSLVASRAHPCMRKLPGCYSGRASFIEQKLSAANLACLLRESIRCSHHGQSCRCLGSSRGKVTFRSGCRGGKERWPHAQQRRRRRSASSLSASKVVTASADCAASRASRRLTPPRRMAAGLPRAAYRSHDCAKRKPIIRNSRV